MFCDYILCFMQKNLNVLNLWKLKSTTKHFNLGFCGASYFDHIIAIQSVTKLCYFSTIISGAVEPFICNILRL